MKNSSILCLLLITLLAQSCAFHNGTFDSGVAITNNQFRIVGTANGSAHTTHILGLGGLATDALVYEAKRDIYSKYPLTKGMALTNVTVDFKHSFYVIAMRTKVMISADIIDFNPEHFDIPLQGFYTDDSTFFPTERLTFQTQPLYYLDRNSEFIREGAKVSFILNKIQTQGVVKEVNRYGLKCEYQTSGGLRKIYLKPRYVEVIQ